MNPYKHMVAAMVFIVTSAGALASSKIDTLYFQHGDRITGEVKSLENNQLKFSTDDAGTIRIEWGKLDSVKILSNMRIHLSNGTIFYGKLLPSGERKSCYIWHRAGDPRLTRLEEIVFLSPLEEKFIDRMSGSLSSGFSYTKASHVMQLNLNTSIKYTAEKNQVELYYDGNVTKESAGTTQRQHGGMILRRILPKKWFLLTLLSAESSTEQQLDLRSNFGIGGGNSIVYSNSTHFYTAAGISGNRENSMGISQYNIEALVTADYSVFIYDSPELSFNIGVDVIPNLSDLGRVRFQVDSNLKWEIFADFFLKWTFFYTYDNRTFSTGEPSSDWAITLLGLEYNL